jgi:hypothetical protein
MAMTRIDYSLWFRLFVALSAANLAPTKVAPALPPAPVVKPAPSPKPRHSGTMLADATGRATEAGLSGSDPYADKSRRRASLSF